MMLSRVLMWHGRLARVPLHGRDARATKPLLACLMTLGLAGCASNPDARTFFVAPTGSDANPGTLVKPFATLPRAQQAVRQTRQAMLNNQIPSAPITVFLRGGTFPVREPILFTPADSGTSNTALTFAGQSFAEWQALGYDTNSVVADPAAATLPHATSSSARTRPPAASSASCRSTAKSRRPACTATPPGATSPSATRPARPRRSGPKTIWPC